MKMFISYSRKQQDKAIELDKIKLKQFYWWMDYRIVGTVDWWKNICEAIEESYCMIALMSKTYVESVYCMGELEYALKLNKPVLAMMLEPEVDYPDSLNDARVQYVDMFDWDMMQVLPVILESMVRVTKDYNDGTYTYDMNLRPYLRPTVPTPPPKASDEDQDIAQQVHNAQGTAQPRVRVGEAIIQAMQLLDDDQYNDVIDLLEPVRPHAKAHDEEVIAEMLREARLGIEYQKIAVMVKSKRFKKRGCTQYQEFVETYPDYPDEQNIGDLCDETQSTDKQKKPLWQSALKVADEVLANRQTTPRQQISISTPLNDAIERARNFDGTRNSDWTPYFHTFEVKGLKLEMCLVPRGRFMMGSDGGRDNEKPVHEQVIDEPFWIGVHPITNAQYRQAVEASGGAVKVPDWAKWYDDMSKANHPVVGVTWYQCRDFVTWLNDALTPNPSPNSLRGRGTFALPTEVKWEYSARGLDNLVYPFGNDFQPDLVVYDKNSGGTTAEVGGRPQGASWVGAQDMAGNVWDWTASAYEPYPYQSDDGRENMTADGRRVLRGGAFSDAQQFSRASYRDFNYPSSRLYDYGFRIVVSPILSG